MLKTVEINGHPIGKGHPAYVIAEAGVNHNGSLEIALELVRKAKECGVDCVKFQTFKASQIVTATSPKANYQLKVTDASESQFEMLEKLQLERSDYLEIINLCKELDIQFLSTPYNKEDADFLESLGVDCYKIASGQLVELPFLAHVARKNKPIIVSTGMANLAEVYEGIQAIRDAGNDQIILLQCTTNYPSRLEDANILAMNAMQDALDVQIGYSDHVENNFACLAAVARGACLIEKHFTLDRNMDGPDHSSSLDSDGFKELVDGIRNIEKALGSPVKTPTAAEVSNTQGMRRSLVLNENQAGGTLITEAMIGFKRPATGLAPKLLEKVIGKKLSKSVPADIPLTEDMIEW